jgi:predicted nucleic acid-binding Zn ribbon protein
VLKLGDALGGWAPGEGDTRHATDPLVLLGAAWAEIVGATLAQKSHPSKIEGDTLVIKTAGSGWSHALSCESEKIVAAIRARLPKSGVEKLRFRIGTIAPSGSLSAPRRVIEKAVSRDQRDATANADEALARLRAGVEAAERAKRARGWKECSGCTALIAPDSGSLCVTCDLARNDERERRVSRLLFEAPWLGYAGTSSLVEGLSHDEYEGIRRRLLMRWWERLSRARMSGKLSRDGSERLIASSYVLLKSELAPEKIGPATVRNVLGDELHDLLYGSEHTEQ